MGSCASLEQNFLNAWQMLASPVEIAVVEQNARHAEDARLLGFVLNVD